MSCVGLYADVGVLEKHTRLEVVPKQLKGLVEAYERYKQIEFSATEQASSTLQLIQIFFDTASYDQVLIEPRSTWGQIYYSVTPVVWTF